MVDLKDEILEAFKDINSDKDYLTFNIPLYKLKKIYTIDEDFLPDPYPLIVKKDYLIDLMKNKYIGPALVEGLRNGVG